MLSSLMRADGVGAHALDRLHLANCTSIRDESAGDICKLRHLADLDVSCCSLTDEGTGCLQKRLPHLQTLNVGECW